MGREAKRNEDQRALHRKVRDQAHQAFVQAFAVLSNALAVSVVITEPTGSYDANGVPEGQTMSFTVCHSAPEVGLGHLNHGSELLHRSFAKAEADIISHREKQAVEQADGLPTPEGMEDDRKEAADDERWPEDDQGPNPDGTPGKPLPGDDGGE